MHNGLVRLVAIVLLGVACSHGKKTLTPGGPDAGNANDSVDASAYGSDRGAGLADDADAQGEVDLHREAGDRLDGRVAIETDGDAALAGETDVAQKVDAADDDSGDASPADLGTSSLCSNGCLIAGVCYPAGVSHPGNACLICDVRRSLSAWSNNEGALCDDGKFCTVGDSCSAGACAGRARNCSDGVACNGVETCDEVADRCEAGVGTCTGTSVCEHRTGSCVATCTGCVIGGVCYGDGQANPANPCLKCVKTSSASGWSHNDGAPCDDGKFCTVGDTCSAGECAGSTRNCSDGIACNGVEICNESNDTCVAGSNTCVSGICDAISGACVPQYIGSNVCLGCLINGVCYGHGQANPANPCQKCAGPSNASAWSPNDGALCDDGRFCTVDDKCLAGACAGTARVCDDGIACNGTEACDEDLNLCAAGSNTCSGGLVCEVTSGRCMATCSGCIIDGICYGDGVGNPSNPCQKCDATASASGWTNQADDTACNDGRYCSMGETCKAGRCEGSPRVCDDGVACNGEETCDEDRDVCAADTPTCAAGTVCDHQSNQCIPTCPGCRIGGVCYGDGQSNPGNPCQTCDRASKADDWTNKKNGDSCDDGLFCTVADACDGAGACKGTARVCDDLITCNGKETCDESKDACVAGTAVCPTDTLCDVVADQCVATCGGCVIDQKCYGSGQTNPENPCEECPQGVSATAWGKKLDGATCDDGVFCNGVDTCSNGSCGHAGSPCVGGTSCVESKKACYLVSVALCNADGDVVTYNANGAATLVEDCVAPDAHGTCAAGVCGCAEGYGGKSCESLSEMPSPVVFVSPLGSDSNDGSSWVLAVASVQKGIDLAVTKLRSLPRPEVWVAKGIYTPTSGTDRSATFLLKSHVSVYGGFSGTEVALGQRNIAANPTVLSGEIGGPGASDNSYHVVIGATGAVIDGFTITGGNANGSNSFDRSGGGMLNPYASPTVTNCSLSGNSAASGGGGMYNDHASPTLTNCTFSGNSCGFSIDNPSANPATGNSYGGGMYNLYSSPIVTNCAFMGNSTSSSFTRGVTVYAYSYGGGMYNDHSSPTVTNCTFTGNSSSSSNIGAFMPYAYSYGGGMHNNYSSPTVTNCTFAGNLSSASAAAGGGWPSAHAYGGGMHNESSSPTIRNSIFWGDTASSFAKSQYEPVPIVSVSELEQGGASAPSVTTSIVQGGYGDNISQDPLLSPGDVHLLPGSPAIDQGTGCVSSVLPSDKDGNPRWDIAVVGNRAGTSGVDIGAYEYQGQTSSGDLQIALLCPIGP